jgi:PAS domain S-box-containing protein
METPEASHDRLQETISDAAPEHLLLLDGGLRVRAASNSFYAAFQVPPGESAGKKLAELGNGQWNIPALLAQLALLARPNEEPKADSEFHDLEIECGLPASGPGPASAPRTLLAGARRLTAGGAQNEMILLSIRDATARKRVSEEAGALLTLWRATLASIGYAVIVTDPESCVTFMNPAAEKITGWGQEDALRKPLGEIFKTLHERSLLAEEGALERAIREGAVVGMTSHSVLVARDGGEWPIDGKIAPVFDAAGRLTGIVLVFQDVSNRRQSEQELEISEVRYRRLFESAHDGILILDAVSTKVLDVNPFMADLLGYHREHFLGKELWEIGVFHDAEISKRAMLTLQRMGRIRYEDLPLQHKDGRHVPVEFVSNVYREGRRNVIQCNIRDITERKRLSHELAQASLAADAANRAKSDFLANMSHEIRTPLGAILGFAEMLLTKGPEECAQAGCIQIIRRNSQHLLELINEILDLSKVEAGQMRVERTSCDLATLLSEIVSFMRPRANEKGLSFGVTFQDPIPRLIASDPLRLRQILVNLLGNAVKFTESGRVDMRIADEGAGGPNIVLCVDVIDSGIGIAPEAIARLFVPFSQGDTSITRKFGGTGLGLAISRQLARLLGGDITATSQPGGGSTFTLKVDGGPSAGVEQLRGLTETTLSAKGDHTAHAAIRLRGRILLVEDGADNQRLLQMQLADAGASVTTARDGQIAVDLAARQTFDLILMDMQMPVLDGYAATRKLRHRGLTLPIIALTAYAMSEDREKCLASGCSGYLSKPLDEETLLKTVGKYLGNGPSPLPADSAGTIGWAPSAGETGETGETGDSNAIAASGVIKCTQIDNPRILEIVPVFVAGFSAKVQKMTEFLERNDLPGLERIAHQLAGTCGGYGFAQLIAPARALEKSVKERAARESIAAQVKTLIEMIRRVEGYDESKVSVAPEAVTK